MKTLSTGFALLLSVLILAAVGVFISTTLLFLSVSSSQTTSSLQKSSQAKALADACVEKALQELIISNSYVGSGSATFGGGSCTYTVSTADASNAAIVGVGVADQTTRRVRAILYRPQLRVTSWQETSL